MDRELDSKLEAMEDSPAKADLITKLAAEMSDSQPQEAARLCQISLDISLRLGYIWGQAESLGILSFCEIVLSDYPSALKHAQGSLTLLRELGAEDKACRMENQIACIHRHMGNYRLAVVAYLLVGRKAREIGDRLLEASAYNNLGIVHYHLGEADRALEFYRQALDLYRSIEEPRFYAGTMVNIADIQRERGEYQDALNNCLKAAMIMMEYGDKNGAASAHHVAGNTYRDMGDPVQAMDEWEKCIRLAREIGDVATEASALISTARMMISNYRAEEALEVLDMARSLAQGLEEKILLKEIYSAYADAWSRMGDEERARENASLAQEVDQKIREQKLGDD